VSPRIPAVVERALTEAGYHPGRVIGGGMEGVVVDLGDDLVAKTWHTRSPEELDGLLRFYRAVRDSGLALSTPMIVRILAVGDRHATVERRLRGRPLREEMGDRPYELADADVHVVLEVLAALRAIAPTRPMSSLPVLAGESAFDPDETFGSSLATLVERRARRFRTVLDRAVPRLDRLVAAVASSLRALTTTTPVLIHGDLIPANILVDDVHAATGILDFGFLSTVGDPRFDAAVAAGVHDMYGPRGQLNEGILDAAIVKRFGSDQQVLNIYRAAYALVTSNCFSASGSDGHFAWCAALLNRPVVRRSVGISL
jgi:aminoglycoside phosphotransferase (APT) family kinase protein